MEKSRHEIRQKLQISLDHLIFEVFANQSPTPFSRNELKQFVLGRAAFPSTLCFAIHAALLNVALNDEIAQLPTLLKLLKNFTEHDLGSPTEFSITSLSEEMMHKDDVAVLSSAFADDIGLTTALVPAPDNEINRATVHINTALSALKSNAPVWCQELLLLGNQIYFASSKNTGAGQFSGAAVFDAFGAVLLNPALINDPSSALMALVHESSHQQMFMFHLNDPILLNDATAAYASPLRKEPRPMEGIFHALWVSARMVVAAEAVINVENPPPWSDQLVQKQSNARTAFLDCAKTVAKHAELTELGQTLYSDAQEAIDAI